jgi:hypothetical protein
LTNNFLGDLIIQLKVRQDHTKSLFKCLLFSYLSDLSRRRKIVIWMIIVRNIHHSLKHCTFDAQSTLVITIILGCAASGPLKSFATFS